MIPSPYDEEVFKFFSTSLIISLTTLTLLFAAYDTVSSGKRPEIEEFMLESCEPNFAFLALFTNKSNAPSIFPCLSSPLSGSLLFLFDVKTLSKSF